MVRTQFPEEGFDFERYMMRLKHDAERKHAEKRKEWERASKLKRHGIRDLRYTRAW